MIRERSHLSFFSPLPGALPLKSVTVTDDFWSPRREIVRTRSLSHQQAQMSKPGHHFDALKMAWKPGQTPEPHIFWDSDIAKWIEAASNSLAAHPDPALEKAVDSTIELLAGAQQDDGYLNTHFTLVEPDKRWTNLRDQHELYCAGHLIEAAVAHTYATGSTKLLGVVTRYVDLIDRVFADDGPCSGGYPGHEEIELALVKLARLTNQTRYLELAQRFIDRRGQKPSYFALEERARTGMQSDDTYEYHQAHRPVREQDEAVGHAVRAMYLYTAMADLAIATHDQRLRDACETLWNDVTTRKMYVTGGVGSEPALESFGPAYHLPNEHGYAETCAAIGLVFWAQRMAYMTGQARYIDVLERALYNGVLSGASLDGMSYFYDNPLESDGTRSRSPWFGCACCPPNFARLLTSLEYFIYSIDEGDSPATFSADTTCHTADDHKAEVMTVNLYISSEASWPVANGSMKIQQTSNMPWDGDVSLTVSASSPTEHMLRLRIPQWASSFTLAINGESVTPAMRDGYACIERTWHDSTQVDLRLAMDTTRVWANPRVGDCAGKVAIERGPLVYCAEEIDNDAPIPCIAIADCSDADTSFNNELGLYELHLSAAAATSSDNAALYSHHSPSLTSTRATLVPYYAWNNRGQGAMAVWLLDAERLR